MRDSGRHSQRSHPSRIWLGLSLPGVRTKTCPLFRSLVRVRLASCATVDGRFSCETCVPAASGLGLCPSGCGLKPVRFFDHLSELFRCMNQGNQNGIEPEPSGQYWSASLFRCRCFCCCVQGAHFRPQFSKSTISCLPVQSPFESAWQYTVFWFS